MNIIKKTVFLSCVKANEIIEKKFEMKLSTKERILLKIHNVLCPPCAHYEKHSHMLEECIKNNIASPNPKIEDVDKLKAEIMEKLKQ